MEKIIVACDSYKGCMSSSEVNGAIARSVGCCNDIQLAGADIVQVEMSDGGEGMLDAFLGAFGGMRVAIRVHDALMRSVDACYGMTTDGTAIIEVAQAVGLAMIEPQQRNPLRATSWGVGEMIMDAWRNGARQFVVGLGGSATSDCGIGMLRSMGDAWRELRSNCSFVLASDVDNPLYGINGAAHVFAPQKGADAAAVEALDSRAQHFAEVSARHFGYDRSLCPGAGAAGGLGYAFMQFFNAVQQSGAELLLHRIGFDRILDGASLVITGEGHSDRQTLMGKLPVHVLSYAQRCGVPVWLVSGGVDDVDELLSAGFLRVVKVTPDGMALSDALKKEVACDNINAIPWSCLL